MWKIFVSFIVRDLTLYIRRRSEWAIPVLFFVMVFSVFPMALEFSPKDLAKLAPAIIWISCVLALLLSLETVFRLDFQEGSLEQFVLSPCPLFLIILGKSIAHWFAIGLPLVFVAPFMGLALQMSPLGLLVLFITLLLGMPTLCLVGTIGAALTIGLHRGGIFLSILVLPLMIPTIVFGASGVAKANDGVSFYSELLLLGALLLLSLVLAPLAAAAALRVSVEQS